jgi:hypothetical protein
MTTGSFRISVVFRGLALAILALPLAAYAQQEGVGYINVRFADVKPDSVPAFEAALKDIGASLRDGGVPFFHVYQRIRGDMGYTIVTLDPAYNEMPPAEIPPELIARITSTLVATSVVTLEIDPAIGIASDSFEPVGNFMHVRVRTTSPANRQGYFEWQRDDLLPVLREAGVTDRRAGRIVVGGNLNTFVEFTYSDKFPSDLNVGEKIGERRFGPIIERGNALTTNAEDYEYVFRRDLGFTAEQQ